MGSAGPIHRRCTGPDGTVICHADGCGGAAGDIAESRKGRVNLCSACADSVRGGAVLMMTYACGGVVEIRRPMAQTDLFG